MPCSYYLPGEQEAIQTKKFKDDLDKLTRENDQLREAILKLQDGDKLSPAEQKKIAAEQVKHRKEDLARLKKTFTTNKDALRLGKVMLADPKKPLEKQLGFDPDAF